MASVFLSYAREDLLIAEALAKALERAGHQIWWDRHIRGGSRFAGAIEEALREAQVVLVLWSRASVNSPWVHDEASEGRDTHRLVPVVVDGSRPPIGFRQFQSIDLSAWSGKGKIKHGALLAAIEETASGGTGAKDSADPQQAPHTAPVQGRSRRVGAMVVALMALVALAIGSWLYLDRSPAAAATPTLAVLPFADLSPEKDKSYFSEGIAEAILSTLGRQPGVKVIGRTSAWQFKDGSADLAEIQKALGVTHILEGSARTSGNALRVSVRLIDVRDGSQIWSEEYQRGVDNVFAVQDEIGASVAQRLRGSLSPQLPPVQSAATGAETYGLYLAARAKLRDRKLSDLRDAVVLSKQVIASDPDYGPGHALYADAVWLLSRNANSGTDTAQGIAIAKKYAARAIQLSPQSADGYAALGSALSIDNPQEAIEPLARAVQLEPTRGETRHRLAGIYARVDRGKEALENYRAAYQIEPLWGIAMSGYVQALVASGKPRDAEAVLRTFEARGGSPAFVARVRGIVAEERGDLSEALRLTKLSVKLDPDLGQARESLAFLYHRLGLGNPNEVRGLLSESALFYQLHATGRYRELNEEAARLGPAVWTHPHAGSIISALAETRDWQLLARLYGQRQSPQPLCLIGVQSALRVAIALNYLGRGGEAGGLLACVDQRLRRLAQASVRSAGAQHIHFGLAQIQALQGRGPAAYREMNQAIDAGLRSRHGQGLSFAPAFDRLRGTPEYRALDDRLKRLTARERQEALQHVA